MDDQPLLEAVPNFSAGRDAQLVDRVVRAVQSGIDHGAGLDGSSASIADLHRDSDHDRSVLTLVGCGEALYGGLGALARACEAHIDLRDGRGVHPRVGALDVVPIVALGDDETCRAAAHALAQRVADAIGGELNVPVVRYGLDARGEPIAGAANTGQVRRGGPAVIAERIAGGELQLLAGPMAPHPRAGVTICGVRDVLIAFNIDLETDDVEIVRAVAARIRESAGGDDALPGVRALGLRLESRAIAQVSTNIDRHRECGPARVVDAVARIAAELGTAATTAELVGLAPETALAPLRYACTRHGLALATGPQPSLDVALDELRQRASDPRTPFRP